jgi:hypothetical protein
LKSDLYEDILLACGFWVKNNPTNREKSKLNFFARMMCMQYSFPYHRESVRLIALKRMHQPTSVSIRDGSEPYLIIPSGIDSQFFDSQISIITTAGVDNTLTNSNGQKVSSTTVKNQNNDDSWLKIFGINGWVDDRTPIIGGMV